MTRIFPIVMLALLTMNTDALAEKPDGQQRPGQRAGGPRAAGQQARNPEQMVARMMETFDKDGDQKLDMAELTAMFTAMRERRGQGGVGRGGEPGQGGAARRRGGGAKPAGAQGQGGRRGKAGGEQGKAGGERPKRPAAE